MGISDKIELENELRKIADYIVTLRREIAVLQANEMHMEKIPAAGQEFSAVAGFTYNFKNQDTQYQNGIDFHLDWGVSQFLSKQVFVGLVGYAYQQVTDDFGQNPILGGFRSRVFGIGPQLGYLFPVGDMQGYLNVKAYGEFAAENRPSGWNTWLTFSISPMAPPSTVAPTRHLVTK